MDIAHIRDELRTAARELTAGGSVFVLKSSKNYKSMVERNMQKWFKEAGEYEGVYVRGSLKWGKIKAYDGLDSIAHHFTFMYGVLGEKLTTEEGKMEARFSGSDLNIQVVLNS